MIRYDPDVCARFLFFASSASTMLAPQKGVAILATIDLLYKGIWATFYVTQEVEAIAHRTLTDLQTFVSKTRAEGRAEPCFLWGVVHTVWGWG